MISFTSKKKKEEWGRFNVFLLCSSLCSLERGTSRL